MQGSGLFDIINEYTEENRKKSIKDLRKALKNSETTDSQGPLTEFNGYGDMPLHYAVRKNKYEMIEVLVLEAGANLDSLNKEGKTIIDLAYNDKQIGFIETLRDELSKRKKRDPLHLHSILISAHQKKIGKKELYKQLYKRLKEQPDEINQTTFYQRNACHLAAFYGFSRKIIELLVDAGGDLFARDYGKRTPVDLDISNKSIVLALFTKQTEKNQSQLYGEDPAVSPLVSGLKSLTLSSVSSVSTIFGLPSHRKEKEVEMAQLDKKIRIGHSKKERKSRAKEAHLKPTRASSSQQVSLSSTINTKKKSKKARTTSRLDLDVKSKFYQVCYAIEKNQVEFLRKYFPFEVSPNDMITELKGSPSYLTYSFQHRKIDSFVCLISLGAKISLSKDLLNLVDPRSCEHFNFLCQARKRLENIIESDSSDETLKKAEAKFIAELCKKGLKQKIEQAELVFLDEEDFLRISKKIACRVDFLVNVYEYCSCLRAWDTREIAEFDPHNLRIMVIGLLARPDIKVNEGKLSPKSKQSLAIPIILMEAIAELYPLLGKAQKLLLITMVKEMIVWDHFYESFQRGLFKIRLRRFRKTIKEEFGNSIPALLKRIRKAKSNIYHPVRTALIELDAILGRFKFNTTDILIKSEIQNALESDKNMLSEVALILANDIRVLSYHFFCLVQPLEFEKYARKEKYIPEVDFPNINFKVNLFESISLFFIHQILFASSDINRAKLITLAILTVDDLTNGKIPDYDGAMSIIAALSHNSISRLTYCFSLVENKYLEKLKEIDQFLSPLNNYKKVRNKMAETTALFPSLPIYARDFMFLNENHYPEISYLPSSSDPLCLPSVKYPTMAKSYLDIIYRQQYFRTLSGLNLRSDLTYILIGLNGLFEIDDELYQTSIRIQLIVPALTPGVFQDIEQIIKLYIEKDISFHVTYEDKQKYHEDVIKAVFEWLKSLLILDENPLELEKALHIFSLTCKAVKNQRISVNPLQYYQKLHEAAKGLSSGQPFSLTSLFDQEKNRNAQRNEKKSRDTRHVRSLGRGYQSDSAVKSQVLSRRQTESKVVNPTLTEIPSDFSSTDISPRSDTVLEFSPRDKESADEEDGFFQQDSVKPLLLSTTLTRKGLYNGALPLPLPDLLPLTEEQETPVKTARRSFESP